MTEAAIDILEDRQELIAHTVEDEVYRWMAQTASTAEDSESIVSVQVGGLGGVLRFSYALKSPDVSTEAFTTALKQQVDYIVGQLERAKAGGVQ